MDSVEDELKMLLKVWISVYASLTYCYFISKKISKGYTRFICFLPIIILFTLLPLTLSSVHLSGTTGFFIAWLGNFKLLLFAFDQGPLSSSTQSISLLLFISIACLPIKIKQDPNSTSEIKQNPSSQMLDSSEKPEKQISEGPKSPLNYAVKVLLLGLLLHVYEYKQHLHPNFILFLYCFHIYFMLELILVVVAAMVRSMLGLELESQFEDPFLSTSLQDFWGKRWNLMVTSILRPTVYIPVRSICTRFIGKKWAVFFAVQSTFAVSGLMHELIFYYFNPVWPTWEVMWFFALHGISLAVEIEVKKKMAGKLELHRFVSRPLTVGFVVVTGFWLFFPQIIRGDVDLRAIEEYAILGEYLKGVGGSFRESFNASRT